MFGSGLSGLGDSVKTEGGRYELRRFRTGGYYLGSGSTSNNRQHWGHQEARGQSSFARKSALRTKTPATNADVLFV